MNELQFTLPGKLRIKKNSRRIFGAGKFKINLPSKAYEEWERQARSWKFLFAPKEPITAPVHVEAHIFYSGQQPDLSGCLESVGDCLQGVVWANDKQIISWDGSRLHHDKKNPRTEIIVRW